jgi:hypothetical protein
LKYLVGTGQNHHHGRRGTLNAQGGADANRIIAPVSSCDQVSPDRADNVKDLSWRNMADGDGSSSSDFSCDALGPSVVGLGVPLCHAPGGVSQLDLGRVQAEALAGLERRSVA